MDNCEPVYQGIYFGPEGRELTVALRTKPCRFSCLMCCWKNNQSEEATSADAAEQISNVLRRYESRLHEVCQFSFGNEGSVLDEQTLQFDTLLEIINTVGPLFPRVSMETHPLFVTQDKIDAIRSTLGATPLEVTIGLETSDDSVRRGILKKPLSRELFEEKVALLSANNIFIKCFLMLKPSPHMSESEGIEDCVHSVEYLHELGRKYGNPITIHINPTFINRQSVFADIARKNGYRPPTLWSIVEVLHRISEFGLKTHIGLSTEGIDVEKEDIFRNCDLCDSQFRRELRRYNRHHDVGELIHNLPHCECMPDCISFRATK